MASFRKTQVQSWDKIRHNLIQEFDTSHEVFDQVLDLSRVYICTDEGNIPMDINGLEYFERLEGKLEKLEMLNFLITVMKQLNLHTDMGTMSQEKVLKDYKEKLEQCQRAEMEEEKENKNFIGRESYINDIVKIFTDDKNKRWKGVNICGMGGLGKTALANQICRELKGEWRIVKVDLREVFSLRDMLLQISNQLTYDTLRPDVKEIDIFEHIKEFLRKDNAIECRTILMLDNIEDVMEREGINRFCEDFVKKFCNCIRDKCKIRLLLTSRLSLLGLSLFDRRWSIATIMRRIKGPNRVYGLIVEKDILPLDVMEALKLFERNIGENQVDSHHRERIVKLCGYSPIAIIILCKSMRHDGLTPETVIQDLGQNFWHRHILRTPNVALCLEKSFKSLNQCAKISLIRLSVFHSAEFDILAATDILSTTATTCETEPSPKEKLDILKLRSFIEISEDELRVRYSLHPMVFLLLKGKVESKEFEKEHQIAKKRFVQYFIKEICKIAMEKDKNYKNGNMMLGNNVKHIKNFYEVMATDDLQELVVDKLTDSLAAIVEGRRIYEIADILLYDDTKWSLIQNVITTTKDREDSQLQHMFWCVYEIGFLLDMDRNEEAKKKIDCLDKLINKTVREEDDMAMAAVTGSFFFQRGRYCRKEYKCEKALQHLKRAEEIICKERKVLPDHEILLSKIYNVMGGSEYRKKNYKKAKNYHKNALKSIIRHTNGGYFNIEAPEYLQNIGTCFFKDGESLRERGKEKEAQVQYEEAIKNYESAILLSKQMNLDKMEIHAQMLQNQGEVYCALESWDKAEEALHDSMVLRRKILSPPNRQITIVHFKTAQFLYKKGVWLYHERKKVKASECMLIGKQLCENIADLTIEGGLPVTDPNYPEVKALTFKLLDTLQEHQTSKLIRKKYKKFEKGAFDKQISKKHSIEKSHFSKTWREPTDKAHCDSDSSDGDNVDDDDENDSVDDDTIGHTCMYEMSEREKAVDFTGLTCDRNALFQAPNYLCHGVLKASNEEEDIISTDRMSTLIADLDMSDVDSCENENNSNVDNKMHLNRSVEVDNIHRGCVGEDADPGTYDTSMHGITESSIDMVDCVMPDSSDPNVSAETFAGDANFRVHADVHREQNLQMPLVSEPTSLNYNMDNNYLFAASEHVDTVNKKKIEKQTNHDVLMKEEDTYSEEMELASMVQKKRKRSANQQLETVNIDILEEEEDIAVKNKRRHMQGSETR